ncbi:nuclear transport factor 2 family protein [Chloroflexota bacterium]
MVEPSRIQEISDRLEIQDLLSRYCTVIDYERYDDLDYVFTQDAIIDYTAFGGIRGEVSEIKRWLAEALGQFPMTQHVVNNFNITIEGDRAKSRCAFYNPMGLPLPEGKEGLMILFFGGYYNDTLVRTNDGWRISERIEEYGWQFGELPEGFGIPE